MMVVNVPAACTIDDLREEWPVDGTWDFLYLPMFAGGKRSIGYAFINFVSSARAMEFAERWRGQRLSRRALQRSRGHVMVGRTRSRLDPGQSAKSVEQHVCRGFGMVRNTVRGSLRGNVQKSKRGQPDVP